MVVGGMSGWQIALIAIVASLIAATAAVLVYRAWTIRVRLRTVRP
jgi:LPS O-antigen subunit length determinant protein (WzzB/FepE family)